MVFPAFRVRVFSFITNPACVILSLTIFCKSGFKTSFLLAKNVSSTASLISSSFAIRCYVCSSGDNASCNNPRKHELKICPKDSFCSVQKVVSPSKGAVLSALSLLSIPPPQQTSDSNDLAATLQHSAQYDNLPIRCRPPPTRGPFHPKTAATPKRLRSGSGKSPFASAIGMDATI